MGQNLIEADKQLRKFELGDGQLIEVSYLLLKCFKEGLSKLDHGISAVKMFPTYIRDVPNGTESGKFLALDLGGSKFRVLAIDLRAFSTDIRSESEVYDIPEEIMIGTGEELFDHIAACLADFMKKNDLQHTKLPLGFTFSFPCEQTSLLSARLVNWTKGFSCSGVIGEDIAQLLLSALQRREDIQLDLIVIVNDTTGTLMSCAHTRSDCWVGLIIGTGTNACYMENLENVEFWTEKEDDEPKQLVINTEWGGFGDDGCLEFIRTTYDDEVDDNSINPGKQLFEKMISGMYLGEIVRRIIVDFIKQKLLFDGLLSVKMNTFNAFPTEFISLIEHDRADNGHKETKKILKKMDMEEVSTEEYEIVKLICSRVSKRAAYLVSSGIATILEKMKKPRTTIGVDGSVYRYHPYFKTVLEKKIRELTSEEYEFELMLSVDGSGRGAALSAAVVVRGQR